VSREERVAIMAAPPPYEAALRAPSMESLRSQRQRPHDSTIVYLDGEGSIAGRAPSSEPPGGDPAPELAAREPRDPREDYNQLVGMLSGLLFMRKRTRDTAATLMPRAMTWLRKRGHDDEVGMYSVSTRAIQRAIEIQEEEERMADLYRTPRFQRAVDEHNAVVAGEVAGWDRRELGGALLGAVGMTAALCRGRFSAAAVIGLTAVSGITALRAAKWTKYVTGRSWVLPPSA